VTRRWEDSFVRVQIEGGHRYFFERFLDAVDVKSLTIVSPWITAQGKLADLFTSTCRKISVDRIPVTAVLRHPEKESVNTRAIALLAALPTATVYTNNELHANSMCVGARPSASPMSVPPTSLDAGRQRTRSVLSSMGRGKARQSSKNSSVSELRICQTDLALASIEL
jgi:hypothetical protein